MAKKHIREEKLNTYLSDQINALGRGSISANAEVRSGSKAIDITVVHAQSTSPISLLIEAKFGTSDANRQAAALQARSRLDDDAQAVAWGLCYPEYLRDGNCSQDETKQNLAEAELVFAPVSRTEEDVTWRTGSVSDFVSALIRADLVQQRTTNAIEATIREAAAILLDADYAPALADALALPKRAEDLKAASLVASLVISNAAMLHHRLRQVPHLDHITTLNNALGSPPMDGQSDPALPSIRQAWQDILGVDYKPVFEPALAALNVLDEKAAPAVRLIADNAIRSADALAALRLDSAGPLFHRLLASAKYDGSFYTSNTAAMMLARLALDENFVDWHDADEIAKLKIIDPACGTGTLLMAAAAVAQDRHAKSPNAEPELLHLAMVSDVLYGLDIGRHALQLAAANLTLGAPTVDYKRMNLHCMRHGQQPNGDIYAGSLELLPTNEDDDEKPATSLFSTLPNMEALGAEHVESAVASGENLNDQFDLAIMNPPFTRGDIRNRQYSDKDRRALQDREISIAQSIREHDEAAFEAIDQTSVRTFFSPLADQLLKGDCATLAQVLPTTALTSASGIPERVFLADRFQIETVITSHDPQHMAFSENTEIHESLIIARRPQGERQPTRFISLAKMPRDTHEAMLLSDLINKGKPLGDWGAEFGWPWHRIKKGDWNACQFYDEVLAEALYDLMSLVGTKLRRAGQLCKIEPGGQRIREAFTRQAPSNAPWTTPILWDHKTDINVTMNVEPDVEAAPKPDKEGYAQRRLLGKASRLLLAYRLYTSAVRIAACYAAEPLLGSSWAPVTPIDPNPDFAKALCAWWNSTPGIITLLHCRSKKLTYPQYSLDALRQLLVPDPKLVEITPLIDAFEQTRASVLLPWPEMDACPARAILDQAAAAVLRMDGQTVADWRKRITLEPTVSEKRR